MYTATEVRVQTEGRLENQIGITEYDVLVPHCQAEIYRRMQTSRRSDPRRAPPSAGDSDPSPVAHGKGYVGRSIQLDARARPTHCGIHAL